MPPRVVVKIKSGQAWKKPFGMAPGTQSELHKCANAISDLEILRRPFLGHFPYARHFVSHLYIQTWAGAIAVPTFLM